MRIKYIKTTTWEELSIQDLLSIHETVYLCDNILQRDDDVICYIKVFINHNDHCYIHSMINGI
jgi:hypothetical protein